jgi:NAD(P)H dehydrogenase (quinone)
MEAFGDPLQRLWRDCVFGFCGVTNVIRRAYGPVAGSSPEERARWLADVAALVAENT